MKVCPTCARQYTDDQLFCKEDGMELVAAPEKVVESLPAAITPSKKYGVWVIVGVIVLLLIGVGIWKTRPGKSSESSAAMSGSSPENVPIETAFSQTPGTTPRPVETPSPSPKPTPQPSAGDYPGERFPQTRQRTLSEPEVAQMGYSDTRYAINEIYARHGYAFQKASIRRQFSGFSWYHPAEGMGMEDIERNRLSRLEFDNARALAVRRQTLEAQGAGD